MDIEAQRLTNLRQKQRLLEELNLHSPNIRAVSAKPDPETTKPPVKKRRLNGGAFQSTPSRTSARIAASGNRISYDEEKQSVDIASSSTKRTSNQQSNTSKPASRSQDQPSPHQTILTSLSLPSDLRSLLQHYNTWTPSAPPPTLLDDGTYHFPSHPTFHPNKAPLDMLLEGSFGGAYFSPWYSRTLSLTLEHDYLHTLPSSWLSQLDPPQKYLTSAKYNPELTKYGVWCGQTLSQWEEAGWINFRHDPRGWFEWYIRFWLGRRLEDGEDERQVGRWARCVGPKGRWKRSLLKKYVEMGVHSVFDDEDDDEDGDGEGAKDIRVSPVMHQTCHHWAYQVRQDDLDEAWRERDGGGGGG